MRRLLLLAAVVAFLAPASALESPVVVHASWTRTPGVRNPAVSQATIGRTVCVKGWTATIRPPQSYTRPLKVDQMRQYGESGSPSGYEEDHLISLELGGAPRDPQNLWPEPYPRARAVDVIENRLHRAVCDGTMTLEAAQTEISRIKHSTG
jgi:hypothetical protein